MIITGLDGWFPIEVKSGSSKNKVQADKGKTLINYLLADEPADIYESGTSMIRQSLVSKVQDHTEKVNDLIKEARQRGLHFKQWKQA